MTSELRPAVEVWREAEAEAIEYNGRLVDSDYAAAAVIEAYGNEREAKGRAEQAAELAKWKALAETLAGALDKSRDGWANALEFGLIPERHRNTAEILAQEAAEVLL
jgi:hypothetical protein